MKAKIETKNCTLFFDDQIYDQLESIINTDFSQSKKVIITDKNVFDLWVENLITSVPSLHDAEIIQLPAGEDTKCIEIAVQVWESLSEYQISRQDLILNFGGGVITDLGGFIASTFKRGLNFINIPTSLLSQVDASIGGKTGIDLGPYKNQIGTFSDPNYVFISPHFLTTLDQSQILSGTAEMLKHGLIQSKTHWNNLKKINLKKIEDATELIYDSIQIKNTVVDLDPQELNLRKSLNFGHTIGHAIEGHFLKTNQTVPHGIAVAWGMIVESYFAYKTNLISKEEWDEIHYVLTDFYPSCSLKKEDFSILLDLMKNDKKNENGDINFTLISAIGQSEINQIVPEKLIIEGLDLLIHN